MFFSKRPGPVEWLVVGLGNPGPKYDWTRHNMGFLVIDELAEREKIPVQKLKFKALTNTAVIGDQSVLLMKPTTYMNLSGGAVGEAARFYKIPPERILVISDDVALPQGKLRIRRSGSAALDLSAVASGAIDVFFECRLSPWDIAAGWLILSEAGGEVVSVFGGKPPLDGESAIVSTNGRFTEELRSLM